MTTKEKFIEMAKNITRPGIDEMMAWLETTVSMRHLQVPNSMALRQAACAHTLSPLQSGWWSLQTSMPGKYTMDELMTVSLFHDVCKRFYLFGGYAQ